MDVGERIFFARAVPMCDIYEVIELNVRTVKDNWFVGVDVETRQAFPFDVSDIGALIFSTQKEAENIVKAAKKKYGERKLTKVTNEETEE